MNANVALYLLDVLTGNCCHLYEMIKYQCCVYSLLHFPRVAKKSISAGLNTTERNGSEGTDLF